MRAGVLRLPRRRTAVVLATAVVLTGAGATAYGVGRGEEPGTYRTATVTRAEVEQVLSTTGTVDAAKRADVGFGVDGTVSAVSVGEGEQVKAGQVVAVLDRTSLRADLTAAEATLAKARAQLESDQDAQSETVTQATTGGTGQEAKQPSTPSKPSGGQQGSGGSTVDLGAVTKALAQLKSEQEAVTSAQSAASAALDAARAALEAQTTACANAYDPVPTPTDGSTPTGDTAANDACTQALADVQAKQGVVKDAQQALSDALSTLSGTLDTAVKALEKAVGAVRPASARTATVTPTITTVAYVSAGPGAGASGGTVTAATLATDQAAIDTARADVLTAQQALSAAVVRAPIAGTIALLDVAKGDTVSAGDPAAVITSGGGVLVDVAVAETKIRAVKVGQQVRVRTPGSTTTSTGRVTSIGVTADATSGTASYPVTVAVDAPRTTLPAGSSVLVDLVLGTAKNAVTVPASAVSTVGQRTVVRVLRSGTPTAVGVTLGVSGTARIQVTKGLSAGQHVVLADLDQAVSGASTTLQNRPSGFSGPPGSGSGSGQRSGTGQPPAPGS